MFYCVDNPVFINLDPRTEYFGGREHLDDGLEHAYLGDYLAATKLLVPAVNENSGFGIGSFMLGQIAWARGEHASARRYWRRAVATFGYTQSPDSPRTEPDFALAAKRMLAFAKYRN